MAIGTSFHGKHEAQRRAQHPRQRRIEDKPRLAGAEVGAGRPMRIENAMAPAVQRIDPRDKMKIEVVPAGVPPHICGKIASSRRSRMIDPRTRAQFVWTVLSRFLSPMLTFMASGAACAGSGGYRRGVKGSAKVVPP